MFPSLTQAYGSCRSTTDGKCTMRAPCRVDSQANSDPNILQEWHARETQKHLTMIKELIIVYNSSVLQNLRVPAHQYDPYPFLHVSPLSSQRPPFLHPKAVSKLVTRRLDASVDPHPFYQHQIVSAANFCFTKGWGTIDFISVSPSDLFMRSDFKASVHYYDEESPLRRVAGARRTLFALHFPVDSTSNCDVLVSANSTTSTASSATATPAVRARRRKLLAQFFDCLHIVKNHERKRCHIPSEPRKSKSLGYFVIEDQYFYSKHDGLLFHRDEVMKAKSRVGLSQKNINSNITSTNDSSSTIGSKLTEQVIADYLPVVLIRKGDEFDFSYYEVPELHIPFYQDISDYGSEYEQGNKPLYEDRILRRKELKVDEIHEYFAIDPKRNSVASKCFDGVSPITRFEIDHQRLQQQNLPSRRTSSSSITPSKIPTNIMQEHHRKHGNPDLLSNFVKPSGAIPFIYRFEDSLWHHLRPIPRNDYFGMKTAKDQFCAESFSLLFGEDDGDDGDDENLPSKLFPCFKDEYSAVEDKMKKMLEEKGTCPVCDLLGDKTSGPLMRHRILATPNSLHRVGLLPKWFHPEDQGNYIPLCQDCIFHRFRSRRMWFMRTWDGNWKVYFKKEQCYDFNCADRDDHAYSSPPSSSSLSSRFNGSIVDFGPFHPSMRLLHAHAFGCLEDIVCEEREKEKELLNK